MWLAGLLLASYIIPTIIIRVGIPQLKSTSTAPTTCSAPWANLVVAILFAMFGRAIVSTN